MNTKNSLHQININGKECGQTVKLPGKDNIITINQNDKLTKKIQSRIISKDIYEKLDEIKQI